MSKSHSLTRGNYEFQIYLSASKISKPLHTLSNKRKKTTICNFITYQITIKARARY